MNGAASRFMNELEVGNHLRTHNNSAMNKGSHNASIYSKPNYTS